MRGELEIRAARREDASAVVALTRATLAEFDFEFGEGSASDVQLEGLPDSYTDGGGAFYVATVDGVIVGNAGMFPVEPGVYELRKMFSSPAARGFGLGQALLDCCLAFARERKARAVVLDTAEAMTRAIGLYEKNGFTRDDTQKRASRCSRGYRLDL